VSDQEAAEMRELAQEIAEEVRRWLDDNRPDLM
jgi:hypothetical protein